MEDSHERYQCQIALPGFGILAQDLLQKARVLIVGLGGLGCPTAQYLVSSGIGTIGIVDDDRVSLSNLHRQILYTPDDIGLFKVDVAAKRLKLQNPSVTIIPYCIRVSSSNVMDLISEFDLIIEGTDNFETKYLINDACVIAGKPLVYGAIYQYEGQVCIWNVPETDDTYSANYRDVFPEVNESQIPNCHEGGVIPPLAGIVGCMQANEAIKYLTGGKDLLAGKLWMINMVSGKTQIIKLKSSSIRINSLQRTIQTISLDELAKMKEDIELIDVRSETEHRHFNIGGKNIPLHDMDNHLNELSSTGNRLLVYCMSGKRSIEAARKLQRAFPQKEIFSLRDGIQKMKY